MIFVTPWVLSGLLALPLLWWLLRVTPPAPRSEIFPAVRFLLGLNATEETPARTPWWLLALRLLAAGLVIVALARPVLDAGTALAGKGPVLLVIDNGWASADDWARRKEAAGALLDRAERAGRKSALLTTAPEGSGAPVAVSATMPVADLRARLAAMQPQPWPSDRAAAADAIRAWHENADASVIYVPDGLTDGADFDRFAAAMRDTGPVTEICCDTASAAAAAAADQRGRSSRRASGAGTARDRHRGQHPRPKRRRAHPGPDQHHCGGGSLGRVRPYSAAAGTAQPADAAGAGRPAQRRLRRAAGRAVAPPTGGSAVR